MLAGNPARAALKLCWLQMPEKYLASSLLEGSQSYIRFTSEDWAQRMNDLVERRIFGKTITKPVYVTEAEALDMLKELLPEALFSNDKIRLEIKNIKPE